MIQEGKVKKFVNQVEHITFSGKYAVMKNQSVLYVTERCVFSLTQKGMELIEIAPGIDVKKDILPWMDFRPIIKEPLHLMDERIFRPEPMNLKDELLTVPLDERLTYHPDENLFFVNFEGYTVRTSEDVRKIKATVEKILSPLGKKVYTIVNYDNFNIAPEIVDEYTEMVKEVVEKFYVKVTGYTTSTFLRMKLGDALKSRDLAPHIYEDGEKAKEALKKA